VSMTLLGIVNHVSLDHICNMTRPAINKLIGYGILVYITGSVGLVWSRPFDWLALIGIMMTFAGIIFYFKNTKRNEIFPPQKEDALTYFWNVIVLKLWVGIVTLAMLGTLIRFLGQILYFLTTL